MSGRKVYIDDWDKPISSRAWHKHERKCDLKENVSIHRKGDMYFISLFFFMESVYHVNKKLTTVYYIKADKRPTQIIFADNGASVAVNNGMID